MPTTLYQFNTPANYTYDASVVEVVGGEGQLARKPVSGTEMFVSSFIVDKDGDRSISVASKTGVLANGAALVSSGGEQYIDISGGVAGKGVEYTGPHAAINALGTIRFKVIPKYNVAPVANRFFFILQESSVITDSQILLYHQSTQNLQLRGTTSTGATWFKNLGNWSAVLDQEYEFEVNVDLNGTTRVFIDGVQFGTNYINTLTLTSQDYLIIGANGANSSECYIRDFEVFSNNQHAIDFPLEIPRIIEIYSKLNPTITPTSPISVKLFTTYLATIVVAGLDLVRQTITVAGQQKYWDGAAWVNSDGTYAQSSTIGDIAANIVTLDVTSGEFVLPVSFLHSDDGRSKPQISEISIDYVFANPGANPTKCKVYGQVLDNCCVPIEGALVSVDGDDYYYDDALIARSCSTTTDEMGEWEMEVIETTTDAKVVTFTTSYNQSGKTKTFTDKDKTIPNAPTAALSSLT